MKTPAFLSSNFLSNVSSSKFARGLVGMVTSTWFKWTAITGMILAVLGLIVLFIAFWVAYAIYSPQVPSVQAMAEYEPKITSRVHAGDGELIAEFASENRVFVPIDSIPEFVQNAFVSSEDQSFWRHGGVDYKGTTRGVIISVRNKIRGSGGLQGGSTITQQVAKNLLVGDDKSIERKFKEWIAAWRMEDALTKKQILEIYMNEIYLGGSAYGVAAASMNYFNKSLEELTIGEAAVLASLPKFPGKVNPYTNPTRLLARRAYVLGRMAEDGYITLEQAETEKAEPLVTVPRLRGKVYEAATYFVQELKRNLSKQYGEDVLQGDGLSIRSTIDTNLQLAAQEALADGLEAYDRRHDYRGPITHLTADQRTLEGLETVKKPGGYGDWEAGLITAISKDSATLTLRPDGSEIVIPEEDVAWAQRTYKNPETKATGLQIGDVVLVEVARAWPEEDNPASVDANPATPDQSADAPTGPIVDESQEAVDVAPVPDMVSTLPPPNGQGILRQIPKVDGGLIALDPHSGRILAMAGGYSFYKSQLNRVTQTKRQIGSSFKPFVYAAALEQGYTPSTEILDAPIVIYDPFLKREWRPGNYYEGQEGWGGLTTLRVGLEKSRNLMTVRAAQDIGMERISEIGTRLGIYDSLDPYLAMALGAGESSIWRLARAYATLVNGGFEVDLTLIDRVQDRYGNTLFKNDTRACRGCNTAEWDGKLPPSLPDTRKQLLDPIVAYQTTLMLKGVVERGTGRRAQRVGKPLAGKTGTTNDYRDALFFGFSPDLVVGIWVGMDDNASLGNGEAGGTVASPIFTQFMEQALAGKPGLPFRRPPGVRVVRVDAQTGKLPTPDSRYIIDEAFRPGTEPAFNLYDYPVGQTGQNNSYGDYGASNGITDLIDPATGQPATPAQGGDQSLSDIFDGVSYEAVEIGGEEGVSQTRENAMSPQTPNPNAEDGFSRSQQTQPNNEDLGEIY